MQEVLSPICEETASGAASDADRQLPAARRDRGARAPLDAAVAAYDNGRGALADHAGRRAHRPRRGVRPPDGRAARRGRAAADVGDRQDARATPRRSSTAPSSTSATPSTRSRSSTAPSSRFAIEQGIIAQIRRAPLGVVLCMGPFNYPLNETFTTLIPALIMGNTVVVQAAAASACCCTGPLLEALPRLPSRPAWSTPSTATGATVDRAAHGSRARSTCWPSSARSRVADVLKKQHPQPAPAALRARPRRQEPGHRAARRRPRPRGQGVRARRALVQRPALHGAQDPLRPPRRSPSAFLERLAAAVDALQLGMPWETGVRDHAAARAGQGRMTSRALVDDAVGHGRHASSTRAAARRTGRFFCPAVVYPVDAGDARSTARSSSARSSRSCPSTTSTSRSRYVVESNYGQQVQHLRQRPGDDRAGSSTRWSTRSAASTSTASASAARTPSRSPAARTPPRARSRSPTRCASSPSARWWRPRRATLNKRILTDDRARAPVELPVHRLHPVTAGGTLAPLPFPRQLRPPDPPRSGEVNSPPRDVAPPPSPFAGPPHRQLFWCFRA